MIVTKKVGHFAIVFLEAVGFRILNINNTCVNRKVFVSLNQAEKYCKQLMKWHKGNKSQPGKRRTARHNEKVVAKYHKTKVQPKDWKYL